MTIYSVRGHSDHYDVKVEWDGDTVPAHERDILLFAAGAASLREGGPVGEPILGMIDHDACLAVVSVPVDNADGVRL
jgi:hypothetical protein